MIVATAKIHRFVNVCCIPAMKISWLILAFGGCFAVLRGQMAVGWTDGVGHPFGDCFINFWSAAKLAATGRVAEIYSWEGFHAFQQSVVHADLIYFHYSYPPVMPLLTLPLAGLPYAPAFAAWVVATWAMFYAALRMVDPPVKALWLSVATPAFIFNLVAGQNGALTAALLGGGLVLLPRRPVLAGILFGLLCFKPQLAFLIPVALVCGKYWRTLAVAGVTALALVALSVILYGQQIWEQYAQTTQMLRHYVLEDNTPHSWQQFVSVFVAAREGGLGIGASYVLQGAFALAALVAVVKSWAGTASHDRRCAALVLGTFMATPYAMDYDLVVMAFVAVWLSRSCQNYRWPVVALLLTPILSTIFATYHGIGVGPLLLLPGFLLVLLPPPRFHDVAV